MKNHGKFFTSTDFRKDNIKRLLVNQIIKKLLHLFLEPIVKAGYATDPNYASKIISIIETWDNGALKPVSKPVGQAVAKPKGKTCGVVKINTVFQAQEKIIVWDKPSTGGRHVATYYARETLKYDSIHFTNSYAWLEYKRVTGWKAYIPIAPEKEAWGSLK